jgi:hypothetical protein
VLAPEVRTLVVPGGIVDVFVVVLLALVVVRRHRALPSVEPAPRDQARPHWVWMGGLALPLVVVSVVLIVCAHAVVALGDRGQGLDEPVDRSAVVGVSQPH